MSPHAAAIAEYARWRLDVTVTEGTEVAWVERMGDDGKLWEVSTHDTVEEALAECTRLAMVAAVDVALSLAISRVPVVGTIGRRSEPPKPRPL